MCADKLADRITQAQWANKYQEAQATATRATKLELERAYDAAFAAYIASAQTYLFLVRHTPDRDTQTRLRSVSGKLLERAERIKAAKKQDLKPVQRDPLSLEEQDSVLQRGSVVYDQRLERWDRTDAAAISHLPTDLPRLSPVQRANQCIWVRCSEALPGAAMMRAPICGLDVVQDNVTDCSVVAALIVAAEHHKRHRSKLALSCLFPQDESGLPIVSPDGRYSTRLLINGTWRQIVIDDRLPVNASGQGFFASTRNRDQLWPALIEKAYLSAMGGYDFTGSNSANDLHVMTGWLPESISLRGAFRGEAVWRRLRSGFALGHCVVTVGTGQAIEEGSSWSGLVSRHNYAVTDVREYRGIRQLVIVNPWRAGEAVGDTWAAGLRRASDEPEGPQTLVVDWDTLPAHFASLHVNWDPSVFDHSTSAHISASEAAASATPAASIVSADEGSVAASNPRFRHSKRVRLRLEPSPSLPHEVWVLLERHTSQLLEKGEYIGLDVSNCSDAVHKSSAGLQLQDKTAMHDNLYDLYRFQAEGDDTSFDLVISHEGRRSDFGFTLSVFSNSEARIMNPPAPLPYSTKISGSWSSSTAGGNHTCHTYLQNPQYRLTLKPLAGSTASGGAVLEVIGETGKDSPLNVKLLFRGGSRVADFESRDVIAGGSTYAYGRHWYSTRDLAAGSYTLVVSSFQPGHCAAFSLAVRSDWPVELSPIPAEGAGMYARQVKGSWTEGEDGGKSDLMRNPRFSLKVTRPTHVKIRLQLPAGPQPIAVALFEASAMGEPAKLVASSGAYSDAVCGVLLPQTRVGPVEHDYVVVPSTFRPSVHADFHILLYADAPVVLAAV